MQTLVVAAILIAALVYTLARALRQITGRSWREHLSQALLKRGRVRWAMAVREKPRKP